MPYYPVVIGSVSAGTTNALGPQVILSNSNGISFGADGSTVTAAHNALTAGIQSVSAGATRVISGELVLSNSNGISFGANGQTVTAQHNALTSQSNQVASAANGQFAFQTLLFSNANGFSFGTSLGSAITGSYTSPVETPFGISASTQSVSTGTIIFSNANGISFGMDGSATITASHNALTSQSNQAASASNGSFAFQTLGFSDANGVTFGTSAGSIVTASVAAALTNINLSAGTASNNLTAFVLSNSQIDFGLNGSTVTAADRRVSFFETPDQIGGNVANGTMFLQRAYIPRMSASRLDLLMFCTGSASAAASLSIVCAIYTMSVSTANRDFSSARQITYQSTSAQSWSNHSGTRFRSMPFAYDITGGEYLFAFIIATTSASTNSTLSVYGRSAVSINPEATNGGNMLAYFGHGVYTAATSLAPATLQISDVNQTGAAVNSQPFFRLVGSF